MAFATKVRKLIGSIWSFGLGGPQVKNNSGAVEMRNSGDSAFVITRGLDPSAANDYVTKGWAEANPADPLVYYAESLSNQLRTATNFAQKVRLTFTATADDYLIFWSAEYNSADGQNTGIRVQVDDTTTIADQDGQHVGVDSWGTFSGFKKITLTAASHNIDMDWASENSGQDVRIRNASLVAYRVTNG